MHCVPNGGACSLVFICVTNMDRSWYSSSDTDSAHRCSVHRRGAPDGPSKHPSPQSGGKTIHTRPSVEVTRCHNSAAVVQSLATALAREWDSHPWRDAWLLMIPKPQKIPVTAEALCPLALQEPIGKCLIGILAHHAFGQFGPTWSADQLSTP